MDLTHEGDAPLYRQIADQLAYGIATGVLAPGSRLPSLRAAQAQWGVHMHTVRRAYRELGERGLVAVRDRGATLVRGGAGRAGASSLRAAVRAFLAQAAGEFGVGPDVVRAEIERQARMRPAVSVIECSRSLAASLCEQLASVWDIAPRPRLLADDRPPGDTVVTTLFHVRELEDQSRVRGVAFAALRIRPSRQVLFTVARRVRARPGQRIAICETDSSLALRIAADLRLVVGPGATVVAHTPEDISRFVEVAERSAVKLVSPRQWDRLDEPGRARPDVVPLHYDVHQADLEALGKQLGWRRPFATPG